MASGVVFSCTAIAATAVDALRATAAAALSFADLLAPNKLGIRTAARIPIIATTISSSMRVKPWFFLFLRICASFMDGNSTRYGKKASPRVVLQGFSLHGSKDASSTHGILAKSHFSKICGFFRTVDERDGLPLPNSVQTRSHTRANPSPVKHPTQAPYRSAKLASAPSAQRGGDPRTWSGRKKQP